ncbi:MAG TPA: MlaD family protein, partial [Mycobacterium sp.]|nr:MlaD family protein [Mycobacterium sp.]
MVRSGVVEGAAGRAGASNARRTFIGLATAVVIAAIVAVCITMFSGGFAEGVPVTVLSPRAGLVMNADARVKIHGVQVGRVSSIEQRPNGQAAIHL